MNRGGSPKAPWRSYWKLMIVEGGKVTLLWGHEHCSWLPMSQWMKPHPGAYGKQYPESGLIITSGTMTKEDMKLGGRQGSRALQGDGRRNGGRI